MYIVSLSFQTIVADFDVHHFKILQDDVLFITVYFYSVFLLLPQVSMNRILWLHGWTVQLAKVL